jgi:hypothetical protein
MKEMNRSLLAGALCLAVLASLVAVVRPAQACGGFFCQSNPIDQSGEYILFSMEESGVRAYIQIQYQGKAEDFAWVVPVMSAPTKVSVGVQQVFTTLMNATAPQFRINWNINDGGRCTAVGESSSADAGVALGKTGGVMVLDQGEVGPYNYVVISANEADKLKRWLDQNGFVQPASAEPALAHYVKQRFVFVAIKLKRGAETGEIQPLVLEMDHSEACVPLVLTRIAAVPDMPVYVLVLGQHRAVPRNWFEVELNLRRIDWFSQGSNYRSLVTAAIDEAAGRAFITEFAGNTESFRQALWSPGRFDLARLKTLDDPVQFVEHMMGLGLPRDPIVQTLLRKHIPMPEELRRRGVTEPQFYNNLAAYQEELKQQPFDAAAFVQDIEERLITPLEEAQAMLDRQPYLTRLFTTVSPEEMTRDPLFDFNPDLKPLSNIHVAEATGTCGSDGRVRDVTLTFENGQTLSIDGDFVPWQGSRSGPLATAEPAARRIQLVGPIGGPIAVSRTQVQAVDQQLQSMAPEVVRELARAQAPTTTDDLPDAKPAMRSRGCSFVDASRTGAGVLVLFVLMGLLLASRRRDR